MSDSGLTQEVNWEKYAGDLYDLLLMLAPYQRYLHRMVEESAISGESRVLDAGCGTGNLTQLLMAEQPHSLTAADYSTTMLKTARKKCSEQVSFFQANLDEPLVWQDDSFDRIVCGNVLYALPNPVTTLRELRRVLSPDGKLVLSTPKVGYENGLIMKAHVGDQGPDGPWLNAHESVERERAILERAFDDPEVVAKFTRLAAWNRTIATDTNTQLYDESSLVTLLTLAGFNVVSVDYTYAHQNLIAIAN